MSISNQTIYNLLKKFIKIGILKEVSGEKEVERSENVYWAIVVFDHFLNFSGDFGQLLSPITP